MATNISDRRDTEDWQLQDEIADAVAWHEESGGVGTLEMPERFRKQYDDIKSVKDVPHLGLDWPIVAWIVIVHLGALAAPFFFTWKAVGICAFLSGSPAASACAWAITAS